MVKTKEEFKASDFKFGLWRREHIKNNDGGFTSIDKYFCSCGTCGFKNAYRGIYVCQKCSNELFVNATLSVNSITTLPSIKIIESTDKKISFSRQNVSIIFDRYSKDLFKFRRKGVSRTVELDIIDGTLKATREDSKSKTVELSFKNGEIVTMDNIECKQLSKTSTYRQIKKVQSLILRDIGKQTLINMITNQNTEYLLVAYGGKFNDRYRYNMSQYVYDKRENPLGAMCMMTEETVKVYQTLASSGVPQAVNFNSSYLNLDETKPHKILGVNKKFMKWFKMNNSELGLNVLEIGKFMSRFDSNFTDEILNIIQDESDIKKFSHSLDRLESLIDYGYNDFKALVLYLSRHCRMHQGIVFDDASTYLRDYVRIQRDLGLEWEKYPKSLKKVHDVAVMNNRVLNNKEDDNKFKVAVNEASYRRLVFEDKKQDFVIVKPEKVDDLKREGEELTHCVASYVDDVQRGNCKILFLRDKNNPDVPLATIEVRGQRIRQARIKGNGGVSPEQRDFIKLWSKEKNLIESYY